ncbi:T-box transcription factor tbx-9 [Caenorhabditis elegans]|uniref:T-box transcription factor tbx-9 n=1 Tax=Caenorhabditis elegans TaxID=6239 RepID=TBX9_CAEEL|nr:T-box transcription factor tbx-9 [Caenorhabditis elegans]Q22289.2 RecName: Full=T-box transcription factor tbx-9 [Caenorhabditis elegans]BAC66463.1 T-box transcription factor TBX-9 [Caenorhabditis elegans]CAA82575.2 T-box transcription factor tbx-9 [Caenorhabditis elegans]|eukprot:NP_499286.2 T-box transcription factor tbx-9 [Caenorhabditis elegans]
MSKVKVSIEGSQETLWKIFHAEVNEMIVTKNGRKLFPKLEYIVEGLDENKLYAIMLQLQPVGESRFKFSGGKWQETGKAEKQVDAKKMWHADGVRKGSDWMWSSICFDRVKISNYSESNNASMIYLNSMHKYIPVLTIYESPSESPFCVPQSSNQIVATAKFPHTEFIAVTAYQNQKITDLKIKHNSFAKGFRDGNLSRKRRSPSYSDGSNSQSPSPKSRSPPEVAPLQSMPPINPFLFYFPHMLSENLPVQFPFAFPFLSPLPSTPSSSSSELSIVKEEDQEVEEDIDIVG